MKNLYYFNCLITALVSFHSITTRWEHGKLIYFEHQTSFQVSHTLNPLAPKDPMLSRHGLHIPRFFPNPGLDVLFFTRSQFMPLNQTVLQRPTPSLDKFILLRFSWLAFQLLLISFLLVSSGSRRYLLMSIICFQPIWFLKHPFLKL